MAALVGVSLYVGTWFSVGLLRDGYDPMQQAISELFDLAAPRGHVLALSAALVVTGLLLVPFAALLHRRLPGTSLLGPVLLAVSGVMTALVPVWPCTEGCPGFGTTTTDTMHVLVAGSGYVALVTAPLGFASRLWAHDRSLARLSLVLGSVALGGFLVRNAGVDALGGLQQRVFNTTADLWIALMALAMLRPRPPGDRVTARGRR